MPSNEEIVELLKQLEERTADELESQALDFVSWCEEMKENLRQAVEGVVSFANAEGGVVVFGVEDKVVGRRQAITGCCGYDLHKWRQQIYENTRPNLRCTAEEMRVPEGALVLVRVPESPAKPCGTTRGVFKVRVGRSNKPLDPSEFGRATEPPLSPEESKLLVTAAEHAGHVHLIERDQTGAFVRVPGADDMYDIRDPDARADHKIRVPPRH
jgi:ATP-dependent DNA helicase RecG